MKAKFILISMLITIGIDNIVAQTSADNIAAKLNLRFEMFSPEKVYLHTDRDLYNAGDTIWFKGYLQNKSYYSEYPESNFIYVELSGTPRRTITEFGGTESEQSVMFRAKIKRDENGFSGYIPVNEEWLTNRYFVRAYTHWMLNEDPEYVFKKEIGIINVLKDITKERVDTLKGKNDLSYDRLGLSVPEKRKKVDKYEYDVQFLPESGIILAEYPNTVGIKAINNSGEGISVTGKIYNAKNDLLAEFKTNEIGMTTATIPPSSFGEKLIAEVSDSLGNKKIINMPQIHRDGAIINYINNRGDIAVNILTGEESNTQSMSVIFHNGSEIYLQREINKNITRLKLKESSLTPGIHTITLFSGDHNIVAERIFFVFPKNKINTDILMTNSDGLRTRAQVDIRSRLTDEQGAPVKGEFSVSVIDNIVDRNHNTDNIISYMLLSSELTGYIEDPQRYFQESTPYAIRAKEIDYLMLTQGWRYYDSKLIIQEEYPIPIYGKEYNQSISGVVKGLMGEAKQSMISITARDINFTAIGELKDGGRFILENISFPEGTNFMISAHNKRGRTGQYYPALDHEPYAPVIQYYTKPDKIEYSDQYKEETVISQSISGNELVTELDAAIITAPRVSLKNNPTPFQNMTFRRDQIRTAEDMKQYENMDIFEYVSRTFPSIILAYSSVDNTSDHSGMTGTEDDSTTISANPISRVDTPSGRFLTTTKRNRVSSQMNIEYQKNFPITVYINKVISSQEYLESYLVSDIENMVYVDGLASDFFTTSRGEGGQFQGEGVLFITLKKDSNAKHNIIMENPLGWQKKATFYAPKYQRNENALFATDRRYTIHWEPYIKSNEDGYIDLSFFASDRIEGYRVVIEGITEDGSYYSYIGNIK